MKNISSHKNQFYSFGVIALITAMAMSSCSASKYQKSDSPYTIQSTYNKLISEYPFIKIRDFHDEAQVESLFNLKYKRLDNKRSLRLDIHRPSNVTFEKLPCVIMIHGGGWMKGSKENLSPMAKVLALNNFVTVVVEYRLGKEALYPAAVEDITAALVYINENASQLQIDRNKIAIYGCSAGAQLATLVGVNVSAQRNQNTYSEVDKGGILKAIVNIDGIVSFVHIEAEPEWNGKSANAWLGNYANSYANWIEASPLSQIHNHVPPTLFVNSSVDRFHAGRNDYVDSLSQYGIKSEVHTFEDSPHSFWFFEPWFDRTLELTVNFLNAVFVETNSGL